MTRVTVAAMGVWALLLSAASAQPLQQDDVGGVPPSAEPVISSRVIASALEQLEHEAASQPASPPTSWQDEGRACPGCPKRSVAKALIQATVINGLYELANLARGQVTAEITPKTWWANMQQGWVWDLDDFAVNQVGHPYQGSNYFDAGRANGLSFYESAAVTAFGSTTWEYFGETNHPSLNDFINTTLGGIALGEMLHRTAWLVRSPRTTGAKRFWNEFGAMAISPVSGLNRIVLSHEGMRPYEKPPEMMPSNLSAMVAAGGLWRGSQTSAFESSGEAFLEADAIYGNPDEGRSRTPYDAFAVRGRFGGGSAFSEARVRGRLMAQPFAGGKARFAVLQSYDYQKNDAYATGSQSIEATVGTTKRFSDRTSVMFLGWGGLTVLAAIDSLPLGVEEVPVEEEESEGGDAGQGVSEGPRFYDYGPGTTFGGTARLTSGRLLAVIFYEGRHVYSLDGVRANHLLQRTRVDVVVPVFGPWGIGVAGEYFDRRTFFQDPDQTRKSYQYPQFRAFLTWSK
jgi:hypothetical protein